MGGVLTPQVFAIQQADLRIDPTPPPWQDTNGTAIDTQWRAATTANPALFDGTVYAALDARYAEGCVRAIARPMRFATLTFWRHMGMPGAGFRSLFGNIILRGRDGGLIFARTGPQNATAGMIGFPGGTMDQADVTDSGLNARGCCLRECAEETGLSPSTLDVDEQMLAYLDDHRLAIGCIAHANASTAELADQIRANLAAQAEPELAQIYVVQTRSDLSRLSPHVVSTNFANWIFDHD